MDNFNFLKRMKKGILPFVTAIMAISLFAVMPQAVNAQYEINGTPYSDLQTAINTVPEGGTTATVIVLTAPGISNSVSIVNRKITFDLGANNLIIQGQLTVTNNSEVNYTAATGKFTVDIASLPSGPNFVGLLVDNGSSCRLTGVKIDDTGGAGTDRVVSAILCDNGSVVTVEGDIEATDNGDSGSSGYGVYVTSSSKVTVMNGDITADFGVLAFSGSTVTVNGNITASVRGVSANNNGTAVTVTGNIAVSASTSQGVYATTGATVTVNGDITAVSMGVYAEQNGTTVMVTGYIATSSTASYGVRAINGATVTVNGDILQAAYGVESLDDGTTVMVTGNITAANTGVNASNGAAVTVTGNITANTGVNASNGAAVTVNGNIKSTSLAGAGVYARNGSAVTVNGNIEAAFGVESRDDGTTVMVTGNITATDTGVNASNGAAVTVNGGDITATNTGVNASNGATVTVNGGDITADDLGVHADQRTTVMVTGDIKSTSLAGSGVFARNGSAVTVNGNIEAAYGVSSLDDGTTVMVTGNITASLEGASAYNGTTAGSGPTVTVDGAILGTPTIYITAGATDFLTDAGSISPTTKTSYLTYTDGSIHTVWVRDPLTQSVTWNALTANGNPGPGTVTTTVLTLDFTVNDPASLAVTDITVTGATPDLLTSIGSNKYELAISNITVLDGEDVTVTIASQPSGYFITPKSMTVTVYVAPIPPTITSASTYTCTAGTAGSFALTATGTPLPITFTLDVSAPAGVTVSGNSLLVVANTVPAGVYTFDITASNGTLPNATQTFTLTVNTPPAPAGTAPRITGATEMRLNPGYAATSTTSFTVTGTSPVAVTKTKGDSHITWNNSSRTLDIAPGLAVGTYPVELTATNAAGSYRFNFTLTVEETVYYLNIPTSFEGGTVEVETVTPYLAVEGETVTVTVTPNPGYTLESVTVYLYGTSTVVPLTCTGNTCTFIMPAHHISLSVVFASTTSTGDIAAGLKAYAQNGVLYIGGLAQGTSWNVCNILGIPVSQGVASSDKAEVPLPGRGIYIVTDGKTAVKVNN